AVEWGLPYGTALPYGVSYGVGAAPAQDPGSPRQSPAAAANTSRSSPQTEGVRVSVNVLSDHKDLPVLFVVRQKEAVVSFQVPLILRGLYQRKYAYQEVSRTLCQPQTKAEVETQHFYVDVSTLSLNASYQLRVTHVENFVLRTNERFSFNATAAQPQVRRSWFPRGSGLGDCEGDLGHGLPLLCHLHPGHPGGFGCWGLSPAAITVQKKDFPSNSFYVVVVVKTEDEVCGGALPYYPLSRDVPAEGLSWLCAAEAYVRSMLFCLGIFLSFYILTLLIACWESWHGRSIPDSFLGHSPYDSYGYGSFGNGSSSSTEGVTDSVCSAEVPYGYVGECRGGSVVAAMATAEVPRCRRRPALSSPCPGTPSRDTESRPGCPGKGLRCREGPWVTSSPCSPQRGLLRCQGGGHARDPRRGSPRSCSGNSGFPLKGRSSSSGAHPPSR
uniref:SID1 transmembrane family member 2 n=1 Tax=Strigops habroptila TaxID=2489341 RepID=A0A672V8E6_STRHB